MLKAVLVSLMGVAACATLLDEDPCSPAALADNEAAYLTEATIKYKGYTYDDCPYLPEVRAKHKAYRQAWERCE